MKMDMDKIISQMTILNSQKLFQSSELLGNLVISNRNISPTTEALTLFADALYGKEEYRRAMNYYLKALQACRPQKKMPSTTKISKPDDENQSALLKYKVGQCHLQVGELRAALTILESILPQNRTLQTNVALAQCYIQCGNTKSAISSYKDAIKQNGYLLEGLLELVKLGVPISELRVLYSGSSTSLFETFEPLLIATSSEVHHEFHSATEQFTALERQQSSMFVLQHKARCEIQVGTPEKATATFERLRIVDPYYLDGMDIYASLLKAQGNAPHLNKLCADLLRVQPNRPEPWVATSMYWELKGNKDKALAYLDKALELDGRHTIALILKGNLLIGFGAPDQAITFLKKALQIGRSGNDMLIFSGLVRCFLALGKIKEALAVAKEARRLMPTSAQALTLFGMVLSQPTDPGVRKKAMQCFEEALKLDKSCLDAVLGISQLNVVEGKVKESIELLEAYANQYRRDFLHVRLADVLTMSGKHNEALSHYSIALNLNPYSESAKHGIDRVEKLMKGLDPDADEEIEEQEEEADEEEIEE